MRLLLFCKKLHFDILHIINVTGSQKNMAFMINNVSKRKNSDEGIALTEQRSHDTVVHVGGPPATGGGMRQPMTAYVYLYVCIPQCRIYKNNAMTHTNSYIMTGGKAAPASLGMASATEIGGGMYMFVYPSVVCTNAVSYATVWIP